MNKLLNQKVYIKPSKEHWYGNMWGHIVEVDEDYYTIELLKGKDLAYLKRTDFITAK